MKLPAVTCRVSSGIAPKPTRLRSMSYGAVASPSLSSSSLWRRLIIPAAPICRDLRCASTSCRVFWRRRIKKLVLVLWAALLVFGYTGMSSAGLIEGFEGDAVGSPPSGAATWIGNVTVETGSGFTSGSISATEGDNFLYLTTGPELTGAGQSIFDRDEDGEFENDIAVMSMSFTAPEGSIVSFDYDVLTEEILGGVADIYEIELDGSPIVSGAIGYASGSFPAVPAFSAVLITGPHGSSYEDGRLGWSNVSIAVTSSGPHTLEFYVGDSGDAQVDTAVVVDNIQIMAPASEPMPAGGASGGGCFIGTAADRSRR